MAKKSKSKASVASGQPKYKPIPGLQSPADPPLHITNVSSRVTKHRGTYSDVIDLFSEFPHRHNDDFVSSLPGILTVATTYDTAAVVIANDPTINADVAQFFITKCTTYIIVKDASSLPTPHSIGEHIPWKGETFGSEVIHVEYAMQLLHSFGCIKTRRLLPRWLASLAELDHCELIIDPSYHWREARVGLSHHGLKITSAFDLKHALECIKKRLRIMLQSTNQIDEEFSDDCLPGREENFKFLILTEKRLGIEGKVIHSGDLQESTAEIIDRWERVDTGSMLTQPRLTIDYIKSSGDSIKNDISQYLALDLASSHAYWYTVAFEGLDKL